MAEFTAKYLIETEWKIEEAETAELSAVCQRWSTGTDEADQKEVVSSNTD